MNIGTKGIHIINGLSAAGCWKQAYGSTNRLIVNQDILSCGPTPSFSDLAVWEKTRLDYLKNLYPDTPDIDFRSFAPDLLRNVERLAESEEIFLWVSTGLDDQLLLLFVVYLVDLVGSNPGSLRLIQYESLPKRKYPVRRIGEINPDQMKDHPQARALSHVEIEYCRFAWSAITAPDPGMLNDAACRTADLPHVSVALACMRRRYPHRASGLAYWDRQLLPQIRDQGPKAAKIIGYTLCNDPWDADGVGDGYLLHRLHALGDPRLPRPLVRLEGSLRNIRETAAELTPFGAEILAGKASSYPDNPIDEWIGGCHLSSGGGEFWFYENGQVEAIR